jgi:hypothetical protein
MPIAVILVVMVVLVAVRYPIVNTLAGWLVVFPIVTVSGGAIAWSIAIQRIDSLYSMRGFALILAVSAVPVALWVVRLNRS